MKDSDNSMDSFEEYSNTDQISFKSAEKVNEFIIDVIQTLVSDRGKLA
jgi:hypothetical protein